jgi:hypothetical protein
MVEEHSGGERGLVHLADAGEEESSDFHDGRHYLAGAMALRAVMALEEANRGGRRGPSSTPWSARRSGG